MLACAHRLDAATPTGIRHVICVEATQTVLSHPVSPIFARGLGFHIPKSRPVRTTVIAPVVGRFAGVLALTTATRYWNTPTPLPSSQPAVTTLTRLAPIPGCTRAMTEESDTHRENRPAVLPSLACCVTDHAPKFSPVSGKGISGVEA